MNETEAEFVKLSIRQKHRNILSVGVLRSQLFPRSIKDALFSAVEISREKNVLPTHQDEVWDVKISNDCQTK